MKEIENFIDELSKEQLQLLNRILGDKLMRKDTLLYIRQCLEKEEVIESNIPFLLQDIPISYLPIVGIQDHRINSFFSCISEYFDLDSDSKSKIKSLGPKTIALVDQAVFFLQNYLEEEVVLLLNRGKSITSGKKILDHNFDYKKKIILKEKEKIIDYFIQNGEDYIFSSLNPKNYFSDKNIESTFSILARYSHTKDISDRNFDSFKKFIKTIKN